MINIIRNTYNRTTTKVKTVHGMTESFEVEVSLHQGSALNPLSFVIVLDVISQECRTGLLWEMLLADDLAITAKTEKDLQNQLQNWQRSLEQKGMKMNVKKTVSMTSGKSKTKRKINIKDTGGATLSQVEDFVYLGSTVDSNGGSEKAVRERVKAGWKKWGGCHWCNI